MPRSIVATTSHFFRTFPVSLALILLAITILRIPTFFEPYWYGDEGIYLVIGKALNRGAVLYTDIVDHKTPLIYYLARVDSQLHFRLLLYVWMIFSTVAFYYCAKKLLISQKATVLATGIFAIFTTLPWFEGNIANGELFVMGFVLAGLWLLLESPLISALQQEKSGAISYKSSRSMWLIVAGGFLYGLGLLTKVPALFDIVAILAAAYFLVVKDYIVHRFRFSALLTAIWNVVPTILLFIAGVLMPVVLSIIYFYAKGAISDYLDFGLLYNFKYAGSWQLDFSNPLLVFFFTLLGKVTFLVLTFIVLSIFATRLQIRKLFVFGWLALALVASLLSNRPYPHYFLQLVPPLSLALALGLQSLWSIIKVKNGTVTTVMTTLISGVMATLVIGIILVMQVGVYPTIAYYKNFILYSTGELSQHEYYQRFNPLMDENYQVASLIHSEKPDKIFIWGTNPMLYALSDTRPVGRFTVSFHIEDLGLESQTVQAVKQESPLYIVVMNDHQYTLPELNTFLDRYYMPVEFTQNMVVWRKLSKSRYN